ncbi:hypothetical protein PVT68_00665 [Microbulbifer bruguierae]|uniref:Red chlorophyll catabolite reductase n=1 Tax=Microbulbifer bruguierae TaxID=3029061 RepID=A0ABY8NDZ7_9GAMM|nr:hypothetical protein [Microbulbifer bruguierae]WGL16827.1 hypothetical protein PVT68_00665 [Microbulbifer bruguierae]
MSGISLPKSLADKTRDRLVSELGLSEQLSAQGGPWMTLESHAPMAQGPVGEVRRYTGGGLLHLVTCAIVVPQIGLDSHMLFAFTPSETAVPHFTLDSVGAGGHCAFHLDLIPRLDLGANLAYMDEVFTPLTEACKAGRSIEGLSAAQLDPRQYAVMSPWMLAHRATPEAFANIDDTVTAYLNHWLGLLNSGIDSAVLDDVDSELLARRDARNKAIIFDPAVDKVWNQIGGLIGEESSLALRKLLTMCG